MKYYVLLFVYNLKKKTGESGGAIKAFSHLSCCGCYRLLDPPPILSNRKMDPHTQ